MNIDHGPFGFVCLGSPVLTHTFLLLALFWCCFCFTLFMWRFLLLLVRVFGCVCVCFSLLSFLLQCFPLIVVFPFRWRPFVLASILCVFPFLCELPFLVGYFFAFIVGKPFLSGSLALLPFLFGALLWWFSFLAVSPFPCLRFLAGCPY